MCIRYCESLILIHTQFETELNITIITKSSQYHNPWEMKCRTPTGIFFMQVGGLHTPNLSYMLRNRACRLSKNRFPVCRRTFLNVKSALRHVVGELVEPLSNLFFDYLKSAHATPTVETRFIASNPPEKNKRRDKSRFYE
jgi:hypothetical protein